MALNVVLIEPQIPQNTGNIARTCVVTGSVLHIVQPMGFALDEKRIRRAGLDYWVDLKLRLYENEEEFFREHKNGEFWFFTTKTSRNHDKAKFKDGCFLIFGSETSGLGPDIINSNEQRCVRIPMVAEQRCLNLSNAVSIGVYEALRQNDYFGMC